MPDVDAVLSIATNAREHPVREAFAAVLSAPVDERELRAAIEARLTDEDPRIEEWQRYSYDKRGSPSPYLDGTEVGFYDAGRRNVVHHATKAGACADFVAREAAWVLEKRIVTG